jgi:hypothetical protein
LGPDRPGVGAYAQFAHQLHQVPGIIIVQVHPRDGFQIGFRVDFVRTVRRVLGQQVSGHDDAGHGRRHDGHVQDDPLAEFQVG